MKKLVLVFSTYLFNDCTSQNNDTQAIIAPQGFWNKLT